MIVGESTAVCLKTWNDSFNDVVLLQLSFIQHSLINPEIFCFADYPCHTVATDILKAPPEDDNREIATWYEFVLGIKLLLKLSEIICPSHCG